MRKQAWKFLRALILPLLKSILRRVPLLSAEIERSAELLPGQYVTIRLTLGTQKGVYLIPQSAVRQLPDGTYSVYLYKDGVARLSL